MKFKKETDDLLVQQETLKSSSKHGYQRGVISGDARTLTLAYSGVIVAIMVELVYGDNPERVAEKPASSWTIFWRGISR
ncbi:MULTISPECIES: hypothetical protein [unclassified Peribacillus]|uniref:hypothetical protein n=1 Tax=unclassified Peribacillus TaxID=2675266 RepID=UPI001E580FAE|nr:hypothetical protein [Peribacillus sp. Bi96]